MTYLPVHCCCNPTVRLGWVPVPNDDVSNRVVRFVIPPRWSFKWNDPAPVTKASTVLTTTIGSLAAGNNRYIGQAVKSNHEPLEVWRQVPGFTEVEPT